MAKRKLVKPRDLLFWHVYKRPVVDLIFKNGWVLNMDENGILTFEQFWSKDSLFEYLKDSYPLSGGAILRYRKRNTE